MTGVSVIVWFTYGLAAVLACYLVVVIALEFVDPTPCGCLTGCAGCEAGWKRVRRNRRIGKAVLAGLLVLAAFALLASALAGCDNSPPRCPAGTHRIGVVKGAGTTWKVICRDDPDAGARVSVRP